jgi:predicted PurR-regulated permease PerM
MSDPESRNRKWAAAVAVALAFAFVYWARVALLPFVAAGGLAYIAAPGVAWLSRKFGWDRRFSAVVVFVLYLCLFGAGLFWVNRVLLPQAMDLISTAPHMLEQLAHEFARTTFAAPLRDYLMSDGLSNALDEPMTHWVGGPARVAELIAEGITGFFLAVTLLFYFLYSGPAIGRGVLWIVPPEWRPRVHAVALQVHPMLSRYVRGLLVIVIYATVVTWIGVGLLLRFPNAVLLSLTTGVLELIPVVGPIASAALLAGVAIGTGKLWVALAFAGFALVLRLSIDQWVGPLVLGKAVSLHPVAVLFAFLMGGVLFGIIGVLLAVPVAATVKIVLETWYGDTPQSLPPGG